MSSPSQPTIPESSFLHPLSVSSHQFTYSYDYPLQCIAKRYTSTKSDVSAGKQACTILFAGGISLNEPTYIPMVKELFRLSNETSSSIHIRSIWVLERPDHGDAGVVNEETLREHYLVMFRSLEYAQAIRTFLEKDFLSTLERQNLIGLGHSGGCGSLMQALELAGYTSKDKSPFSSFIFVELPLVSYEAQKFFMMLWKAIDGSNSRRPTNWDSKQTAMRWFKTHFPWKTFHPDVLRIVEETYFRQDRVYPNRVTTKTAVEQETMNYLSDTSHLSALPYLRTIFHVIPTHIVLGSKKDIWPQPIYEMMERNVQQDLASYASVKIVPGVGHYFPLTHPALFSAEIFSILDGSQTGVRPKL
ncbi:hypothetical protein K435DRAFT_28968 [Dendrothele bispora CBS 962.96]|uniref:AB hydrolase-1 domain-containing protein n=1 Tax=Dendrothele bispora (strain CBS 962.96) TaxID=1314807 RepID=A0A4V4HGE5_DENBC|nr:hypothetical protein K435DRAFT_28968 [Dendrothele bispora CBS 962.96]